MKTVFSLTFLECVREDNVHDGLIGPLLFEERQSAIQYVFDYVAESLVHGADDFLDSFYCHFPHFQNKGKLEFIVDVQQTLHLMECCIDSYFDYHAKEEDKQAFWEVAEIPTMSFKEHLASADAIDVDGQFIRYFENLSPGSGSVLKASAIDDDGNRVEVKISSEDARYAKFNPDTGTWSVGRHSIELIQFKQTRSY